MYEQKLFNEKLDEIRKNMILELQHGWGHMYAGYAGIIITNNKEVYEYQYYCRLPKDFGEEEIYIKKIKDLNEDEFKKISSFIENEIISKEFTDKVIFDANYTVVVNINGISKTIKNNKGYGDNLGLYDITEKLLNEIV